MWGGGEGYRISLIICRTFIHDTSHPKKWGASYNRDVTYFRDFVHLTVRHAYAYALYMNRHMRVSPALVNGNFWIAMSDSQNLGCDL